MAYRFRARRPPAGSSMLRDLFATPALNASSRNLPASLYSAFSPLNEKAILSHVDKTARDSTFRRDRINLKSRLNWSTSSVVATNGVIARNQRLNFLGSWISMKINVGL